jgi:hypothetical protein
MRGPHAKQTNLELRKLVAEASNALALLDTPRLEELALSCEALNRGLESMSAEEKICLAREAREAAAGMAVFARVLEATRSNLRVMNRLRELRAGGLEYSERLARGEAAGLSRRDDGAEGSHGNH